MTTNQSLIPPPARLQQVTKNADDDLRSTLGGMDQQGFVHAAAESDSAPENWAATRSAAGAAVITAQGGHQVRVRVWGGAARHRGRARSRHPSPGPPSSSHSGRAPRAQGYQLSPRPPTPPAGPVPSPQPPPHQNVRNVEDRASLSQIDTSTAVQMQAGGKVDDPRWATRTGAASTQAVMVPNNNWYKFQPTWW